MQNDKEFRKLEIPPFERRISKACFRRAKVRKALENYTRTMIIMLAIAANNKYKESRMRNVRRARNGGYGDPNTTIFEASHVCNFEYEVCMQMPRAASVKGRHKLPMRLDWVELISTVCIRAYNVIIM